MRPDVLSTSEYNFIVDAASTKIRLDGRKKLEYRKFKWTHFQPGNLELCLGNTRIHVSIDCEAVKPNANKPSLGVISFYVNPSGMASVSYDQIKQRKVKAEVKNLLEIAIKRNNVVDLESLCIKAGAWVWKLNINVIIMCDDGNIFDVAVMGCMLALKKYGVPETVVDGDTITLFPPNERVPHPLTIHHLPFAVTFNMDSGYADKLSSNVIIDATAKEEVCFQSKLVMVINTQNELCATYQVGPLCLIPDDLPKFSNYALHKINDHKLLLDHA